MKSVVLGAIVLVASFFAQAETIELTAVPKGRDLAPTTFSAVVPHPVIGEYVVRILKYSEWPFRSNVNDCYLNLKSFDNSQDFYFKIAEQCTRVLSLGISDESRGAVKVLELDVEIQDVNGTVKRAQFNFLPLVDMGKLTNKVILFDEAGYRRSK